MVVVLSCFLLLRFQEDPISLSSTSTSSTTAAAASLSTACHAVLAGNTSGTHKPASAPRTILSMATRGNAEVKENVCSVLAVLRPTVDVLNVYWDSSEAPYGCLDRLNVTLATKEEVFAHCREDLFPHHTERQSLGTEAKFLWEVAGGFSSPGDVVFFIDDDIAYPVDYVSRLVAALDQHNETVMVGVHGWNLREPFQDYFKNRTIRMFTGKIEADEVVHGLGSGTMAWRVPPRGGKKGGMTLPRDSYDTGGVFEFVNCGDLQVSLRAAQLHIPTVMVARDSGWLAHGVPTKVDRPGIFLLRDEEILRHKQLLAALGQQVNPPPDAPSVAVKQISKQ